MKKVEKGCYGYALMQRNRFLILTILFFILMAGSFISGLLVFHSRLNILSVLACLFSLPFAKMLIGLLVTAKFDPMSKEEYELISKASGDAKALVYYDIPINDTEHHYFMQAMYLNGDKLICFIKDRKGRSECKRIISENLKSVKLNIRTVDEASEFSELVSEPCDAFDVNDDVKDRIFGMGV